MKSVFLPEHHPMVEKEIACIIDLCGRIALKTKSLEIEDANRFREDLNKSLASITDLYRLQEKRAIKQAETIRGSYF